MITVADDGGLKTSSRSRVLMLTEGTYPFTLGGVSTWCDSLIQGLPEFEWHLFPVVAGGIRRDPLYQIPWHATLHKGIDVWTGTPVSLRLRRRKKTYDSHLISDLVRGVVAWDSDVNRLTEALVWCSKHPDRVVDVFRSREGWETFCKTLDYVFKTDPREAGTPLAFDAFHAVELYRSLYWMARVAMERTPSADVLHVTCAGWSAIPAIVQKVTEGTPILLTEHGVYVRESYLRAATSNDSAAMRFISTRLARGLSRLAFRHADLLTPVTEVNAVWEEAMGADPKSIVPIYNGAPLSDEVAELPRTSTVISVGRINSLKDIKTLLRVADVVIQRFPTAEFRHYGPVPIGGEAYARSCYQLHEALGLGDRFKFMGPTSEPGKAIRESDVFLMTSISEGLPISLLEAMSEGRPSVVTSVGGVPETVRGCGVLSAPGDVHGLAVGVLTFLQNPDLAREVGLRARARVARRFDEQSCLDAYRDVLANLCAVSSAEDNVEEELAS